MSEVKLDLPDESFLALADDPESAAATVRLAAAVKLYELGRLSTGAAATLAGVPRTVFLTKLADYGVPTFRLSKEELERDLERA